MSGSSALLFALLGVLAAVTSTSPEEDKRRELIERLGIEGEGKRKPKPKETEPEAPEEIEEPEEPEDEPPPPKPPGGERTPPSAETPAEPSVTYTGRVHKLLKSGCMSCHRADGSAGATRFVLTGGVGADFRAARKFVTKNKPGASPLLSKAAGRQHGGGAPFPEGSSKYAVVRDWIAQGAEKGGGASKPGGAPPVVVAPVPTPPAEAPKTSTPRSGKPRPRKRVAKATSPDATAPSPDEGSATSPSPEGSSSSTPSTTEGSTGAMTPGSGESTSPAPSAKSPAPARPPRRAFAPASHDVLLARCQSCHKQGLPAARGGFALTGDATADHATAQRFVDPSSPAESRLLTKAIGQQHGGGATLRTDTAGYRELLAWIEDGALGPTAADIPPEPTPATEGEAPPPLDATTGASKQAEPSPRLGNGTPMPEPTGKSPLPFTLPWHLHLNGKLDFSYERRNYKDHPFGPGKNAFQTYHHFLFLSRSGADDPFGFNVELVTQAFYEFNARIAPRRRRFAFLFKAGKILVPFGPEPLFHKYYGGRSGFDQEILPLVWAQPGIAANAIVRVGPVALSNDVYSVQGYALRDEEGILNLQSDLSSIDDFKAAFGDRFGLSVGPFTGWYSVQVNRLGFDRLLFMQAVDLEFWRLPDVPVMKNLVLGIGGMRADVSGAGPGQDYYHFGSYGMIGYFPIRWLYLQYRAGLRTTDNRTGVFFDERRSDERDRSSHNLTITGRYKGFYAGFQLFWNLEKANEQDDDFLRLTVGYEF